MKHKIFNTLKHKLQWLLLLTALLGVSQCVWGDTNKIHGNFSGSWSDYVLDSNGEVTINISAGNYEFGVKYNNNNTWYTADHTFTNSVTDYDFPNTSGNNAKLKASISGDYKFKVKDNSGKPRLDITFPTSSTTFAEGQLIWLDIQNNGDGWGKESGEKMFIEFYTSSYGNVREMTKVAGNGTNSKKSIWVYRITSTDAGLNSTKIHFRRGTTTSNLWNTSNELTASDVEGGNSGMYINSGWDNVGTKYNAVSNTSIGSFTLDMQNSSGTGGQTSCLAGETVKFAPSTVPSITVNSTSKGPLNTPLYYYSYTGGSYSSGKQTSNPYSWTTTNDNIANNGTATAFITFSVDGSNTPATTPSSSPVITSYRNTGSKTFTVNPSCTTPEYTNFAITSNTNSYTYDGDSHRATVTSSNTSTYAPASITEGYGSSSSSTTTSKTAAGTYNIYVTAASADDTHGYCAVTSPISTHIGTLTISEVTPSSENKSILFDITCESPVDFNGESHGATVSWKSKYKDCGAITVKYYNGETPLGSAPVNVGTYTVKISVAAGTNNYASAADIEVGTITINKIDQSTAVTISNSGTHCITSSGGTVDISASGGNTSEAFTYSVDGTPSSGISLNTSTGRITANNAGSISVKATRPGGTNYNDKTSSSYTYTFVVTPTTITVTPSSAVEKVLPSSVAQPSVTQDITASHTGNSYAWTLLPNYSVNSIADASSANTTITFKREGVYTATAKGGCENTTDVQDNSAAITVKPPLTIYVAGPLFSSANDKWADNNFTMTRSSDSYVYTGRFATQQASNVSPSNRQFTLRTSSSSSQSNYIISKYAKANYTNITSTGSGNYNLYTTDITYSAGNQLEIRAEYKGYNSSENKPEWDISIGLVCDDPVAKTISISDASICSGSDVQVIVNSSQSGYIYTVYDAGNTQVGTTTGDGTNKSISVTRPTESTTYTVKAKQAASCTPTEMANTVSVTINGLPTYTPSEGITQYEPVTVTSTATSPAWSFTKVSGSLTGAWLSTTSGTSTVFKAPTGTYTVSDGNCSTGNIVVSNDTETCD